MPLLVLLMLKIAIALKNKYFPSNSYCETAKTKNVYRILNRKPSFENANYAGPETLWNSYIFQPKSVQVLQILIVYIQETLVK